MYNGPTLLREAARFYDQSHKLKAHAESMVWWQGFSSGADWMHLALEELRGQSLPKQGTTFTGLGTIKYTLASLAAFVVVGLALLIHSAFIFLVIPAFYAVEVQWVFLFPVALDGSTRPWSDSRKLMRRHAGTLAAMSLVLPFAWRMLTGGFFGHGFVRSWCTGCLAVVMWYERCRNAPLTTGDLDKVSMLEIGVRNPLFIRAETLTAPIATSLKLLLITDIHAHPRYAQSLLAMIDEAVAKTKPDLIVLGGDLADSKKGLAKLEPHLRSWALKAPLLAIPGNHDHWLGLARVRDEVINAVAHWLPDIPYLHKQEGKDILWIADANHWEDPSSAIPSVAVLHDPADYPKTVMNKASLTLAGHLHGCQVVFRNQQGRLIPGSWFYQWNVLRQDTEAGTLVVSRGCADTLPIRWNCPREVVLIHLNA